MLLAAAPAAMNAPPNGDGEAGVPGGTGDAGTAAQIASFRTLMTDAVLTGSFTVDGRPGAEPERYEVGAVTHQGRGNWVIAARIKYGANDVTVPVAVEVRWAGDTPVITLDRLTIPGLGTFDARVLVHKTGTEQARYAGTWQHDAVGGCLFGTVDPQNKGGDEDGAAPAGGGN